MCLKNRTFFAIGAVIITGLLACLSATVLLLDVHNVFFSDWNNHLWVIEYFGQSLKHGHVPVMINTNQLVGMPNELFYAGKFYVLSGLVSALIGSAITIRILILLVFLLQFFQVYRAGVFAGSDRKIALGVACVVTWAIYPLTNLYNRSALTEFFAVAFLTCCAASFLCVVLKGKKQVSRYDRVGVGLFFVAAAVTHPLTALFGGVFLFVLGATAVCFGQKEGRLQLLAFFLITALLSFFVLSPWAYLLHQFVNKVPISAHADTMFSFRSKWFLPGSTDHIFTRLSFLPLDLRSIQQGVQNVACPYMDAQITMPLILLIGAFLYVGRREKMAGFNLSIDEQAMIWSSAGMLMVAFVVSVCPAVSGWFGGFFDILQFPYRLVSYVNLSALVILIILAGRVNRAVVHSQQVINVCLAFCIALSLSGLILKLVHASAIMQKSSEKKAWVADKLEDGMLWAPDPWGADTHLNEMPATYMAAGDYFVQDGFSTVVSAGDVPVIRRDFNVLDKDQIGRVEAQTVNLDRSTLVITNVEPFPWDQIIVDGGAQIQSRRLLAAGRQAVLLPQGSHRLEEVVHIDSTWQFLDSLSWVLLIGWISLCLGSIFFRNKKDY